MIASPKILLCDEPTGALDKKTGEDVMRVLNTMVKKNDTMLVLVTHDIDLANTCDVILTMDGGKIVDVSASD